MTEDQQKAKKRPGPKPKGKRPMTSTERSRKRRERLAQEQGTRVFSLEVKGPLLRQIERIAELTEITPTEVLRRLAEYGVMHWIALVQDATERRNCGGLPTDKDIDAFYAQFMPGALRTEEQKTHGGEK